MKHVEAVPVHALPFVLFALLIAGPVFAGEDAKPAARWQVGKPIVAYWCGPPMTDAVAEQMAAGGWNVVWCEEKDLDLAGRHGLRAQLSHPLIATATIDQPSEREKLDALVARVRSHPALYSYFILDEPGAAQFPALGRLVAHLRERDPAHLAYINLFPTYATNEQLGTKGDTAGAYREHLKQYLDLVKPGLISYDHYQFSTAGDTPQYFLNLSLVRRSALDAGLPFLHIVQACTWTPSMRVPTPDEMRYLVYTTLAYGAQGISYYVYSCAGHTGGIAGADGKPTPIYEALKPLNRDFAAIAGELQPLRSLGVYHAGMSPPGAVPLPEDAPFRIDPPAPSMEYRPPEPVRGILLGLFGPAPESGAAAKATHALIVNLDYRSEATLRLRAGPGIEVFDPAAGRWTPAKEPSPQVRLPRGGGSLWRTRRSP